MLPSGHNQAVSYTLSGLVTPFRRLGELRRDRQLRVTALQDARRRDQIARLALRNAFGHDLAAASVDHVDNRQGRTATLLVVGTTQAFDRRRISQLGHLEGVVVVGCSRRDGDLELGDGVFHHLAAEARVAELGQLRKQFDETRIDVLTDTLGHDVSFLRQLVGVQVTTLLNAYGL
jgi:hypothetical protein